MHRVWLLAFIIASCTNAQSTASRWIWYPEEPANAAIKQSRWLRRSFDLPEKPRAASLWLLVDDNQKLWVNGQGPLAQVEKIGGSQRYELGSLLRAGRNALAVEAYNARGPAGVIAKLTLSFPDGRSQVLNSDGTWRAAKELQQDWTAPDFDDSSWADAKVIGSAFKRPWIEFPVFHLAPFVTAEEQAAHGRFQQTLMAQPDSLAGEPVCRYELKYHQGMPAVFVNGQPRPAIWYRGSVDPFDEFGRRQIGNFRDRGIHCYLPYVRLDKCWLGPSQYDFSELDDLLRAYLSVDPGAHMLVQVRLIPPEWWMKEHPNEWVAYATSDQLDSSDEAARVRRASPASEVWLRDTGDAWRAMIEHIEAKPWGKRVMGWHPCYGIYAEWHYFGSWTQQFPDTGAAMTRAFRRYLREKYGTVPKLRAAWADPRASFDTATVPGVPPRRDATLFAFRDPAKEQWVIDYYRCQQKVIADDILTFCRIAKDATGRRVMTGVYYGYTYGVLPQTQGGHLELERLLKSPAIDFFVAPYEYGNRTMGQDGRFRAFQAAFRLAGKVSIVEADTRTYLHPRDEHGRTQNLTESLAALRREALTALIDKVGYWYVDFGPAMRGGWFDQPEIMQEIGALHSLAVRALEAPGHSVAQVAMVYDLDSGYYLSDGLGMQLAYKLIMDNAGELYTQGVPFDTILLSQLDQADLSQYRLLLFMNTFQMSDRQALEIERLRRAGKQAMVFLWAPGLTGPDGVSERRASRVTGFDLRLHGRMLAGTVELTARADPLLATMPTHKAYAIRPTGSTLAPGFADGAAWHNARSQEVIDREYARYDITPIQGGIQWDVEAVRAWTDIHWRGGLPAGTGIGVDVKVEGARERLSIQFVIKDADMAEFVAPPLSATEDGWLSCEWPLASFENAPWAAVRPAQPALPLKGFKVVLRGTGTGQPFTVSLRRLRALSGPVSEEVTASFGEGIFGPALIPQPDGGRVLGCISGRPELPALIASGEGTGLVVYCATPYLPGALLQGIIRQVGVHRYLQPQGDVLRADSRFIQVHTKAGGTRRLSLPRDCQVRDAITGDTLGKGASLQLQLRPNSTTALELTQ